MPQMAPIMWVPLMISFTIILFLSIIKINFSSNSLPNKIYENKSLNSHSKQMTWTW